MRKDPEEPVFIDPAQPALVVVYGSTKRKHRPLASDVVVVGRAPGCDIGLVSPEVAPVHCVLVRFSDGWRLRDCSGRATRVNGRSVRDELLRDGDIIQVGAFSFEAHLPPMSGVTPKPSSRSDPRLEHLKRSRRRLGERALALRARVQAQAEAEVELRRRQADLEQLEHRLRTAHQEGLAKAARAAAPVEPAPDAAALKSRAVELDHFARHLRRQEKRLRQRESEQGRLVEADRLGYEADLVRQRVEVERERRELLELRQAMQQRQTELAATVAQVDEVVQRERRDLLREQENLDRQRQELLQQRLALEQVRADMVGSTENVSTKDTWHDASCPDRLESARQLLRELTQRYKAVTPE